jgi:hypothetical protein
LCAHLLHGSFLLLHSGLLVTICMVHPTGCRGNNSRRRLGRRSHVNE